MSRILHFGLGNFHRAHQAWYTEQANRLATGHDDDQWQITGVSLRSRAVRDLLVPQECDYTLMISNRDQSRCERITAIDDVLVAGQDDDQIVDTIADPDTRIISFTITEKGYHLRPGGAGLDMQDPDVAADLRGTSRTIYGFLARGLARRRAAGGRPITLLCCDNLTGNGAALEQALREFVGRHTPVMVTYLKTHVTCPNCMVDRITPATTDAIIAEARACAGWEDRAPVATEDFSDWVIEDRFADGRPAWDKVGARIVADVEPFELRKLRLLNGAHSYLAYAGTQAGYTHVHEAILDPDLAATARAIMDEATATLPESIRGDTEDYAASLIERFSNPGLHHKLRQIAMDGSQKLPIRLVGSWQDRRDLGLTSPAIEAGISAWLDFVAAETAAGRELQDPMAADLAAACNAASDDAQRGLALLALIDAPQDLADRITSAAA